jgi:hypothetical protein
MNWFEGEMEVGFYWDPKKSSHMETREYGIKYEADQLPVILYYDSYEKAQRESVKNKSEKPENWIILGEIKFYSDTKEPYLEVIGLVEPEKKK